jgi:hypothetical protein
MTKAGLDPEDKSQQKAFLAGMAVAKEEVADACGKDEAEEVVEVKTAQDKAIHDKAFYASLYKACNDVAPIIGRIQNPFAFDSADSVYKFALEKNGKDVKKYPASAYEGMVDMILEHKPVVAEDSAMSGDIGGADEFMKALKKIRK